jgi:TonB family protein
MRLLMVCFFLLPMAGATVQAQQVPAPHVVPVTIFYDKAGIITTKQQAAMVRVGALDTVTLSFKGPVTDYYPSGNPYRQLVYGQKGLEGPFQLYYPDKKLERQGQFRANEPVGEWQFFYPDGKPMQTVGFVTNQEYRVLEAYNFLGQQVIKDGTGQWETPFSLNLVGFQYVEVLLGGQWKNGMRTGQLRFMKPDGTLVLVKEYENGAVRKKKRYDPEGKIVIDTKVAQDGEAWPFLLALAQMEKLSFNKAVFGNKERVLQYILKKEHLLPIDSLHLADKNKQARENKQKSGPKFPGGQEGLSRFMSTNFRIPSQDIRNKVTGTTRVSFVVGIDGNVSGIKVVNSLTRDLDAEVIRVIKLMPKWEPALLNGEPVPFTMTIPYTIRTR